MPRLFEGRLPDLNFGTADGASCSTQLSQALLASCNAFPQYSRILNGRFKGGYITRHYGDPVNHIHAVQLEMAQCCYMDEESFAYLPEKGQQAQQLLERVINTALQWGREQYGEPGV